MKNHGLALNLEVTGTLVGSHYTLNININYAIKTAHEGVSTFVGIFEQGTAVLYHLSEENRQIIEISGQMGQSFGKPKAEANN